MQYTRSTGWEFNADGKHVSKEQYEKFVRKNFPAAKGIYWDDFKDELNP